MRCRGVRSYLSAYCNDELNSRLKSVVGEHLSTCSACRREEAMHRSMSQAAGTLTVLTVTDDFNGKLLNRIAHERFAETRTKAHLPRQAPVVLWRQAIPAFVATGLVVLLAVVAFSPEHFQNSDSRVTSQLALDDSYLTAQPAGNPQRTAHLRKEWSLGPQLERAQRMNELVRAIIERGVWHDIKRSSGLATVSSLNSKPIPYVSGYYKVRPVVRVYIPPEAPSDKEVGRVY